MIIDSHQHFWKYNPKEYDWIDEKMKLLKRDFLPADLNKIISEAGVQGVISVQARQCVEETDWLLKLASENQFIFGVVGWLNILSEDFPFELEKYIEMKKLVGLRHVLQAEADDDFILGTAFNKGISMLKNYNLSFDILIFERHLPQTIKFVDRHPDLIFILDHIAKPLISAGQLSPWKENIKELSKRKNVYCKISGMVTEADFNNWSEVQLQPYFEVVLETFKPDRLMFGSDWPVCLLGTGYKQWTELVLKSISELSKDEQSAVLHGNAEIAYKI